MSAPLGGTKGTFGSEHKMLTAVGCQGNFASETIGSIATGSETFGSEGVAFELSEPYVLISDCPINRDEDDSFQLVKDPLTHV